MKKLIINLAPTGMLPTKQLTPYVPVSIQEIVEDVVDCCELGTSMVHLHARDAAGLPTYKKEIYAEIIAGIRKFKPQAIIIVSTSGRTYSEFGKRSEVLQLQGDVKPDMASLTLSSLNFANTASINSPEMIVELAKLMKERKIKSELEVFDVGMINFAKYLIHKGLIEPPFYFNIILGNIASAQAKLLHAGLMIAELPAESYYSLTGIGDTQNAMTAVGAVLADGVRIGLEDNIWYDDGRTILATNKMLVERVLKIANIIGRPVATAQEVRRMLGLSEA